MAAVTGAIVGLASLGMSIGQASKANREQKEAEFVAQKAREEINRKAELNVAEAKSIQKEKYELVAEKVSEMEQKEAELYAEADPRLKLVQSQQTEQRRANMLDKLQVAFGMDLDKIENAIIAQEEKNRDIQIQLGLGDIAGAQRAAAQAEAQKNQAILSGVQAGVQTIGAVGSMIAPYGQSAKGELEALQASSFTPDELAKVQGAGIDLSKIGQDTTVKQYRQFRRDLTGAQKNILYGTKTFAESVGAPQVLLGQTTAVGDALASGTQAVGQAVNAAGQAVNNLGQRITIPQLNDVYSGLNPFFNLFQR